MNKKNSGFTLIEMLTVLLIISILALIAYPSYQSYLQKAQRLDAINSLFHYQALWQRCLLQVPHAQTCLTEMGLGPNQALISLDKHYLISATVDAGMTQLSAKPVKANDQTCAKFIVNNRGDRMAYDDNSNLTTEQCW